VFWIQFLRIAIVVATGVLAFVFARRISFGVFKYEIPEPARGEGVAVRDFLDEMILFGLGFYFLVDSVAEFSFGATRFVRFDGKDFVVDDLANIGLVAGPIFQFVIVVFMILGRRHIGRYVRSFRTREFGKK
jgi:hypothetical protein